MIASYKLPSLFQRTQPDQYLSSKGVGFDWTYEVGHDKFVTAKSKRIAGYRASDFNTVDDILDLIHPQDIDRALHFSKSLVDFINRHGVKVGEHKSDNVFRAKGKGGKLFYLHRHGIPNGVFEGKLVSNFSSIEDVTWMRPQPGTWKATGPFTESFDFEIPELDLFTDRLSGREIEVLRLVARGFRSTDIGNMLNISPYTVSTHRKNMLKKLEVANTPELMTLTRDMGLI